MTKELTEIGLNKEQLKKVVGLFNVKNANALSLEIDALEKAKIRINFFEEKLKEAKGENRKALETYLKNNRLTEEQKILNKCLS